LMALASPGLHVVPPGREAESLAPVPVAVLAQCDRVAPALAAHAGGMDEVLAALARWGIRTCGEFAALPSADLSARLGRRGSAWQAVARGEDARPLVPARADERFEGTLELEWPIEGLEPLSFVLTRLLEPLSTRLEARDRGAAALHVALRLVTREVHQRSLQLPAPLRDVRTLRTLALLDLDSHPPGAAIDQVTITIDPTPGRILQHTLFARPHPTPEQLSTLLARLGALVGQDRIGAPALVDSHRPGAFAMVPFAIEHRPAGGSDRAGVTAPQTRTSSPGRPTPSDGPVVGGVRRCRQPVPARVMVGADGRPVRVATDRQGFAGGTVAACVGPWRTSGDWWLDRATGPTSPGGDRAGTGWDRDEWDVALKDGSVCRIFRDRSRDAWFVEGMLD
jgi:protein ImuB